MSEKKKKMIIRLSSFIGNLDKTWIAYCAGSVRYISGRHLQIQIYRKNDYVPSKVR